MRPAACFYLRFRLPQAVEITVGVGRDDLVAVTQAEADPRLRNGLQLFALVSAFGLQSDPLDIVAARHRMGLAPDSYIHRVALPLNDGHMLSWDASTLPRMSSFISSPQQTSGTPVSFTMATIWPQISQT